MVDDVLRVDVAYIDGMTLISLRGDVDADSVLALRVVFDELDPSSRVLVDMQQVDFMDSSGLNVLVAQALEMGEAGGSLRIPAIPRPASTESSRSPASPSSSTRPRFQRSPDRGACRDLVVLRTGIDRLPDRQQHDRNDPVEPPVVPGG